MKAAPNSPAHVSELKNKNDMINRMRQEAKHVIDTLRPGDVAIFTTPCAFRWVHYAYAIEKGVNVFMEKPLTPDGPSARKMPPKGHPPRRRRGRGPGRRCWGLPPRRARQARLAGLVPGMQCGGDAPLGRDQIGPPLEQRRRQPGRRRRWHGRQVNSRGALDRGITPGQ